jgi:acetyl esterase
MKRLLRWLIYVVIIGLVLSGGVYAAFKFSPWPSAFMLSRDMNAEGPTLVKGADAYIPKDVIITLDQSYGEDDSEKFDVYRPPMSETSKTGLPLVVWVHGGAYLSGDKADLASYLKILAGRGFVVVGLNYALAPGAQYPQPVEQVNKALAFLSKKAGDHHLDPSRIVLAGDSTGAQIAAQLATVITDPAYATKLGITPTVKPEQLRGTVLFGGLFDGQKLKVKGVLGERLTTALWAYFGTKDMAGDERLETFSVLRQVGAAFPPAYISAGNGDPLLKQSLSMAKALEEKGVTVHEVFFPPEFEPKLDHQFQFDLGSGAARDAFNELTDFLMSVTK